VRTAFYLKGTVRGDLLLTAAYDSDKDTRARLLRDIRPDEVYPVYGDASLRSVDARSGSKLFVRVDKDKSYALFGDFVTGDGFTQQAGQGNSASLKQRSLGQYNRTATGVRLHHEKDGLTGNVFAFHDSLRQVVQEFASQGSGPYGLRNNAVVEGSEKVEVVVRDRQQPARIVSVRALARLVDYSFEPFSGRILLNQFLPSVDDQLNPVTLRVSYEVDQGGDAFWVLGGDAQWRITPQVEIGGSLVQDRNDLAPYDLASANATLRLGPRTALVAELARSQSTVNTNPTNQVTTPGLAGRTGEASGNAWRVELAHEGELLDARLFVGRSDPSFNNTAAPLNGGRGEAQAQASWRFTDTLKLQAEALASEDRNTGGGTRKAAGLGLQWLATDRLTLDAGLRTRRETVGTQANGWSTLPFGDTSGLSSSIVTGAAGGAAGLWQPDRSTPPPACRSSARVAWPRPSAACRLAPSCAATPCAWAPAGAPPSASASAPRWKAMCRATGAGALPWAATTAWVNAPGFTAAMSGRAAGSAWPASPRPAPAPMRWCSVSIPVCCATPRCSANTACVMRSAAATPSWPRASARASTWPTACAPPRPMSRSMVLNGNTAKAQAIALGLDYTADPLWKGSTRLELRRSGDLADTATDERFTTTLWQVMAARKLDRDWTLLARNHFLQTDYAARGDVLQNRAQLGLAWRPVDHNRFNALAKVEHKLEKDASNAASGELQSRAWILSTHADWHPSRPWWLTGRVAGKWQTDTLEAGVRSRFNAQLLAGRVVYDITERWDIGAMAAVQLGQRGARQQALGVEAGYLVQQNLWLSAGYNHSGFRGDAELAGYEYTQQGAYLRLRFKFDETLWRTRDPQINRSLDR
jgi:hypothetical protein